MVWIYDLQILFGLFQLSFLNQAHAEKHIWKLHNQLEINRGYLLITVLLILLLCDPLVWPSLLTNNIGGIHTASILWGPVLLFSTWV